MQSIIQRMAKPRYHIFLSYRREDGKDLARTLKETLVGKGYRVFLDMDELQDGVFDERILAAIEEAPIYMLIMTKHCFDRCHNADDWVRQELEYAIKKGKVIIPINPDRQFVGYPDSMPQHLKDSLKSHQYSAVDTEQLYQESIDKLVTERIRPVLGFRHKALVWAIVLFFVTLVPYTVTCRYILPEYYLWKGDKILQQDSLTQTDTIDAIKYYQYAIDAKNVEGYGRIGDLYDGADIFRDAYWVSHEDSAIYYYKQGAYAGDAYAQIQLAHKLTSQGFSILTNHDTAFYWATRAYEAKHPKAPATLGYLYRKGFGVRKDAEKARQFFREGIANGDNYARTSLGTMLREGEEIDKNYVEGTRMLLEAMKEDDISAVFALQDISQWVDMPPVDQFTNSNVTIQAMEWDTTGVLRVYCQWYNREYLGGWMQIDKSAYIEDVHTGIRYTVDSLINCFFSPMRYAVPLGSTHQFGLVFNDVPQHITLANFCESDTSQWKFFGVHLEDKIHITTIEEYFFGDLLDSIKK